MSSNFAARHWYRFTPLSALLYPASLLFRLCVWLRRLLFKWRILASVAMPVPVIVVGNVTVGGTGKTPLVLWLVRVLLDKGYRPGVIVSGYGGTGGGTGRAPVEVKAGDDPQICGDEAVMVAEHARVPVWSGRQRVVAAQALLRAYPQCDLLICDDGLQHYALRRDIEIAVEDERGAGNGCMLPAGPLREPANRRVDARVVNSQHPVTAGKFGMRIDPAGFYRVDGSEAMIDAAALQGKRLHAVAGIGAPQRFFSTLAAMGLNVRSHAYADHHDFAESDLRFNDCDAVLMTDKDAVKCRRFAHSLPYPLFSLRVEAILDGGFVDFIEKRLDGLKAT
jgi:tetraacyldisaccharide 4'-kinase